MRHISAVRTKGLIPVEHSCQA